MKQEALHILTQSDGLLGVDAIATVAQSMATLSQYDGGFDLFGVRLNSESKDFCFEVLQEKYVRFRTEGDRKKMGRHYTPQVLTRQIVRTTLEPLLPALKEKIKAGSPLQAMKAVLDFNICDPTCGSGCFLVRAIRHPAYLIASIFANGDRPSKDQIEAGLLLAAENCIYGVDKDPLAVELCKLSLWLIATKYNALQHLPLPPLNNIRCGDSLLGVFRFQQTLSTGIPNIFYRKSLSGDDGDVCKQLQKKNKAEIKLFAINPGDKTKEQLINACNCYVAACFIEKNDSNLVPTTGTIQAILNGELDEHQEAIVTHANYLAAIHRWFHWELEFPEVFLAEG